MNRHTTSGICIISQAAYAIQCHWWWYLKLYRQFTNVKQMLNVKCLKQYILCLYRILRRDVKAINVCMATVNWNYIYVKRRHVTRSSIKIKIEMEKIINQIRLSAPDGQASSSRNLQQISSSSSSWQDRTTLITLQVMYTKDKRSTELHSQNEFGRMTRLLGKQWLHKNA